MDRKGLDELQSWTQLLMSVAREAIADARNQRYAAMLRRALERKRDEARKSDASE
jgi:hypothetical protein